MASGTQENVSCPEPDHRQMSLRPVSHIKPCGMSAGVPLEAQRKSVSDQLERSSNYISHAMPIVTLHNEEILSRIPSRFTIKDQNKRHITCQYYLCMPIKATS